jgi:hypothetical protein
VTNTGRPSARSCSHAPRSACTATGRPSKARAAVAPSATNARGRTSEISLSSQCAQASASRCPAVLWMRRLPRSSYLKCFTALARYTLSRAQPSCAMARSSSWPAGPTKGRPARSSWSPGCSPTSMWCAPAGPSPHTAWVASAPMGQARQACAAMRSSSSVAGAAPPAGSRCSGRGALMRRAGVAGASIIDWLRAPAPSASGWISAASGRLCQ